MIQFKPEDDQAGDQQRSHCCSSSSDTICCRILPQSGYVSQSFVLFRPSTDGTRPTHIMEGSLLYPKSTYLNVGLIQNSPTETSRIMFPTYLSTMMQPTLHKTNHHTGECKFELLLERTEGQHRWVHPHLRPSECGHTALERPHWPSPPGLCTNILTALLTSNSSCKTDPQDRF